LEVGNEWPQSLVDIPVYDFGLAISLFIVRYRELDLDSDNTAELVPEGGYKLRSSVRNNRLRSMSESVYLLDIQLSHTAGVDCLIIGNRYRILSESVYKDKDHVIVMFIFIELLEIYIYILLWIGGYRQ
jgi:hypothetical protein